MDYFKNVSYMVSHVFLMLFFYLFSVHRYSKVITGGICFMSFLILCISDCLKLNLFPDSDLCYVVVTIVQILLVQFTGILISNKRNQKTLFIGLSASNYVIVGSVSSSILYIYTKSAVVALAGSFLIHLIALYIVYQAMWKLWIKQYETEYTKGWWELCLIPVFFYCSFTFIAYFPYTLEENPQNSLGILCILATMFVSYVVVLRYLQSDAKQKDIYLKNVLFESYIKGLENQFYLVEQAEKNMKLLRHDMRHYSSMIRHLLDQGEYAEIQKIITHINDVVNENKVKKYCNNLIVNTIISKMMERAKRFDVKVHLDLTVSKELPVNEYEFTAVIANLFENALIGVKDLKKEKREIEIKVHCNEEHLLVQTQNEYQGEIDLDPITGLPKSKKGGNHGLGMQSVLAFSDKIEGDFGCFCQDGIFWIMLFAKF